MLQQADKPVETWNLGVWKYTFLNFVMFGFDF